MSTISKCFPGCFNLYVVEPHFLLQNVSPRRREAPLGVIVIFIFIKALQKSRKVFGPNNQN